MDEMGQGAEALVGQLVAGYRLEAVLGTGLTGAVYHARREDPAAGDDLPEVAAVKVLMPPWQASPAERDDFRERFLREAQTLAALRHPHIVPVLAYGRDEQSGLLYMIMPYLPGGTLPNLLGQATALLPLASVAAILAQLADALDYAHAMGVIHRDVKPANVLLDAQGQVYLTDFSVARLMQDTRPTQTTTGKVLGTYHYMAPEQARGERVAAAADQYSLAVLIYELVTSRVPFDADSLVALALQHVQQDVPPPRALRPDLPEQAQAAILRALAKQPSARFPGATSFARAFAEGLQGLWTEGLAPGQSYGSGSDMTAGQTPTVQGYAPPPTVLAPASPRGTRRSPLVASTLLALLVVVGLVALLARGGLGFLKAATPTPGNSARSTAPTATPALCAGTSPSGTSTAITGANIELLGVATVSRYEAWAVGEESVFKEFTPAVSGFEEFGVILHYCNGAWTLVKDTTPGQLSGITMVAPNEGWAVGGTVGIPGQPIVVHYVDGAWTVEVGQNATPTCLPPGVTAAPQIGDQFRLRPLGGCGLPALNAVAMSSETEGWAMGSSTMLHFLAGTWTPVSYPPITPSSSGSTQPLMNGVAMVSADDGWAVGSPHSYVSGVGHNDIILHYDGSAWQQTASPDLTNSLNGVAMTSATDGWAVGDDGVILHYSSGQWSQVASPTVARLFAVSMVSPSDGWVVGEHGTILHYTNGTWSVFPEFLGMPNSLLATSVLTDGEGWAVGLRSVQRALLSFTLIMARGMPGYCRHRSDYSSGPTTG